ncbi:hypothetical protein FALCPG4_010609 [Fusarium falciforme]
MSFLSPLHEIGNAEYCSFKPQPSCRPCLVDSLGASIIRFGQVGSRATECSDGYTGRVLTGNKPSLASAPSKRPPALESCLGGFHWHNTQRSRRNQARTP